MLQTKLQELRELVETAVSHLGTAPAEDTLYAPLLEVMRVKCPEPNMKFPYLFPQGICPICNNTGYLTRFWDGLPKGALAGALRCALDSLFFVRPLLWDKIWGAKDVDAAACDYTMAVLKEEAE